MSEQKEEPENQSEPKSRKLWQKPLVRAGAAILTVLVLVTVGVGLYVKSLTDLVDYGEIPGDPVYQDSEFFDDEPIQSSTTGETGLHINGYLPPKRPVVIEPTPEPTEDPRIQIARNEQQAILDIAIPQSSKVYNILLIGSDRRPGETTGRSDSLIILSINRGTGKIHLVSLMRGLYVNIPGRGFNLLNAAYSYGGSRLLRQTLEDNFRVRIDDFIMIDFSGFSQAIDSVGGVDISLTDAEATYLNQAYTSELLAGSNHLDGQLALAYARIRAIDSDFSRTGRQRAVIESLLNSARNKSAAELDAAIRTILPLVRTNVSSTELVGLGMDLLKYRNYPVSQLMLPVRGSYEIMHVYGREVVKFDFEKNISSLHQFLFKD